ncbi:MAG: Uma2 family endonuclease [Acetobacteraceae bacterium]|nr:Uma2 family endonuclease [Acetobacteraceae bacterium]
MSAALAFMPPRTLEEFLDWVPLQDERFEWDGVQPVAMVGGTLNHSELAARLEEALRRALRGGPCRTFRSDVGVRTERGTRIRFPDLVVTCSPVHGRELAVPEPVLVVEVLSASSAAIDRGVKRAEYAALPSLSRYVMLAQDAPIALVCARDDGFAERQEHEALVLPEFGLTLPLAELYAGLLD